VIILLLLVVGIGAEAHSACAQPRRLLLLVRNRWALLSGHQSRLARG
jgi:hypothetical protein